MGRGAALDGGLYAGLGYVASPSGKALILL